MPPHMALTLISAPPGVSPQTRTIVVSTYKLGRGDADDVKVDWILPDDTRKISRLHCVLNCHGEDWCVIDVSSNGTFLNHERERLEPDTTYRLMDGDHLQIGQYAFQVRIPDPSWDSEPNRAMWESHAPQSWPATGEQDAEAKPATSDHRLLDRLLEGAGLSHLSIADPSAAMLRLGQAMRAVVAGLRMKQSTPGSADVHRSGDGDNPIDAAGSDEDALAALMGVPEPGKVMREALSDFGYDRPATMAAMRHAVADLLSRLSPDVLRQQAERARAPISPLDMQRKARAWDAFEIQYGQIRRGLNDEFNQTLGEAFTTAYEQLVQSGGSESRPPTNGKERT